MCTPTLSREYVLPSPRPHPGRKASGPLLCTIRCHRCLGCHTTMSSRSISKKFWSSLLPLKPISRSKRTDLGFSEGISPLSQNLADCRDFVGKEAIHDVHTTCKFRTSCCAAPGLYPLNTVESLLRGFHWLPSPLFPIQDSPTPSSLTADSTQFTDVRQVSSMLRSGCVPRI